MARVVRSFGKHTERSVRQVFDLLRIFWQRKSAGRAFDSLVRPDESCFARSATWGSLPVEARSIIAEVRRLRSLVPRQKLPSTCTASVVIPHYNHYQFLGEALKGLALQTSLPEQVIVVDDGSDEPKRVESICSKFKSSLNVQLLISQRRTFTGATRQVGAEAATSDVVIMHDADDISHPLRVEITRRFFEAHPRATQVNVGFRPFDQQSHIEQLRLSKSYLEHLSNTASILEETRRLFVAQRFSTPGQYGIRFGGFGCKEPFAVSGGHVSYPRYLVDVMRWSSPDSRVFTEYEDFEFNILLCLTTLSSFQINLPLVMYRQKSSTNKVMWDSSASSGSISGTKQS
jgi:Glycosyl transferase family 2